MPKNMATLRAQLSTVNKSTLWLICVHLIALDKEEWQKRRQMQWERKAREQILRTCCVVLGNNKHKLLRSSLTVIAFRYFVCSSVVIQTYFPLSTHTQRKCINICVHFIQLAYFGLAATHTFSALLFSPSCTFLHCSYSSFSCALIGSMIARSLYSISYLSPFRTARAMHSASSHSSWRFFSFPDSQSN